MSSRIERDSFGPIDVAGGQLWGAQTQRSLEHFHISTEKMPPELIAALATVKRAAAHVNLDLGLLSGKKAVAITQAADEVLAGKHPSEFPLAVWQTGSGTQSNMNMNEVLANRGSELMGGLRGAERLLHPNDDVNLGQSSNDIFPTAIHVAAALAVANTVLPALRQLRATLDAKATQFADIVKIGRTHLQDATPLTLGQEFSGYSQQIANNVRRIKESLYGLYELAQGGTAVGTGLNAPIGFAEMVAERIAAITHLPFITAPN
ncbi:MAG: class fumarate hydratase, partial [Pseudomonadota bacterium]